MATPAPGAGGLQSQLLDQISAGSNARCSDTKTPRRSRAGPAASQERPSLWGPGSACPASWTQIPKEASEPRPLAPTRQHPLACRPPTQTRLTAYLPSLVHLGLMGNSHTMMEWACDPGHLNHSSGHSSLIPSLQTDPLAVSLRNLEVYTAGFCMDSFIVWVVPHPSLFYRLPLPKPRN